MGLFDLFKKEKISGSNMHLYTQEELKQYEEFVKEQFGDCYEVLHELFSPDIHLDILVIPPTKENNYYKLITMGMGAYKMNVPKKLKKYELERAELILYLPPTWDIHSNKNEWFWPIKQLKSIARLPILCDTWLGAEHSISSDDKNTPYADNTKFCCMLLLSNNYYEKLNLRIKTKGKINFYQVMPLYEEELKFKENNGVAALMDMFDEKDIVPIVNINRKNYCKNIK